jgi:hypothetical protein
VNLSDFSRKGGQAKSAAKATANRAKIAAFWAKVRLGELPPPRRHKTFPEPIHELARRYIWWQPSNESLAFPLRVVAQVLNLGTAADCVTLEGYFGQETMRDALRRAEPGWFRDRSWNFWHYRLGLTPWGEEPPPLPARSYVA